MSIAEKATRFMEAVANDDTHGYDQVDRNGPTNYDCSGLVIAAYDKAGAKVKAAGATYTGNMYNAFLKAGFMDVTSSVNLVNCKGMKRGDVLLNPYHHTAVYCGNNKLVHASSNENGKAVGGKSGDQTGKEICVRFYYNYPWKKVLRYPNTLQSLTEIAKAVINGKYGNGVARRIALESEGYNYKEVQTEVNRLLGKG